MSFDYAALQQRIKAYKGTDKLVIVSQAEYNAVITMSQFPFTRVGTLLETDEPVFHAHEWWSAANSACEEAVRRVKNRVLK